MKNSQLYKGSLNTIVMKLLEENGRMYGYEITQKVKEITKGELKITEGALYPALHKLEAEGVLEVEVEKVDNRLRKYYKLTEKGAKETVNRLAELEEFIRNMQTLVNPEIEYDMKLSKEEIQFIDKSLSENGVIYEDIKLELIDHFASDIEQQMEDDNYNFKEAFKIVFEKWKPELKPTTGTILLVNDFKGPKIVVDRLISNSKQELKYLLIFTLIFGSLMSALFFLNFQDDVLKIMSYLIRASFVLYILVSVSGLLFILISGIKTTYSRLFIQRIFQILGLPLLLSFEILQYPNTIKPFSSAGNLIMNFVVICLLISCVFSVKSLFDHFKTVKKYKLI